jgi:fatty acid amide hydrolase
MNLRSLKEYFSLDYIKENKLKSSLALLGGLAVLKILKKTVKFIYKKNLQKHLNHLKEEAVKKRDNKLKLFLNEHGEEVSKEKQTLILKQDISNLVKLIRSENVTCVEVLITYAIRAAKLGRDLNLLADVDFETGLQKAIKCDEKVRRKERLGLLHGIPFAFYEMISIKGQLTTCGYIKSTDEKNVNQIDALIVTLLEKEGAIALMKSNNAQGFMALESYNNLWGTCLNPWNKEKSTGGSNGGLAGLVASKCIPAGIGSDIFGSIRVPAAFCGCYGFKPTSLRNSKHGAVTFNKTNFVGFTPFSTSWGPFAVSADDVILISECLYGKFTDDLFTNNKPFDEDLILNPLDKKSIKIGYAYDILEFNTVPAIKDTLLDVVGNLKKNGFNVVEFPLMKFKELINVGMMLLANSQTVELIQKNLQGEELAKYYQPLWKLRKSSCFKLKLKTLGARILGQHRIANFLEKYKNYSTSEYIEASRRYLELKYEFVNYCKENKFDALLTPVFPTLALDHYTSGQFFLFNDFSYIYNFVDMPAVTIPIKWNRDISISPNLKDHQDRIEQLIHKNVTTSENLPVAVQIGTLPMHDELTLKLMEEIDNYYKFSEELVKNIK